MSKQILSIFLCLSCIILFASAGITQTRERGATGDSSQARPIFNASCPQSELNASLRPMTTTCAPCRNLVDVINAQIETIKDIEKRLNKAIREYNDICSTELENPCVDETVDPDCNDGERVSIYMTYRGDSGGLPIKRTEDLFGSTGTAFDTAAEMMTHISNNLRRPIDRNAQCRDCLGYLKILQHGHDEDKRQEQIAAGQRPDASLAGDFGIGELTIGGNQVGRDGQIKPIFRSDKFPEGQILNQLKSYLCKDATVVFAQCNIGLGEKGDRTGNAIADYLGVNVMAPDFSTKMFACPTMDSPDAGGGTYKGFPPSEPIKTACEEKFELDKAQLAEEKRLAKGKIARIKVDYDMAIERMRAKQLELAQCEIDKCKGPQAVGEFFGQIFADIDIDKAAHDNEHGTEGGSTYVPKDCPECKPISEKLIAAKKKKKPLQLQVDDARIKQKAAQDAYDKAEKKLDRMIKNLDLDDEQGVGAESTDTRTGERVSAYDNGRGQVEIKRFDAQGNQIGDTEYRLRPSTADKRKKVEKAEAQVAALKQSLKDADAALATLEAALKKLINDIAKLQTAFDACMKKCKEAKDTPPEEPKIKTGIGTDTHTPTQNSTGNDWKKEFGTLIEQLERSTGEEITEEQEKAFWDNPEELYRSLGIDPPNDKAKPPKTKNTIPPKPSKPSISSAPANDFEIEIELEDARNVDGTNAFDSKKVEETGTMGHRPIIGDFTQPSTCCDDTPPPSTSVTTGTPPPAPPQEPLISTPQPPVETPPPPARPLKVSHSGVISFNHTVGASSCPQPAGQIRFTANDGRRIEIQRASVSGTIKPKLNLLPQGNLLSAGFNCSSPENGRFSGNVTVVVRDIETGETQTLNIPASGGVSGSM